MWGLTLTLRQEGICAGAVPGGPAILVATLGCGREQMGGIPGGDPGPVGVQEGGVWVVGGVARVGCCWRTGRRGRGETTGGVGSALCVFAPPPHHQVTCNPVAWRSPLLVFPGHSRVDTAVPDCSCAAWDVLGSVLGAHLARCSGGSAGGSCGLGPWACGHWGCLGGPSFPSKLTTGHTCKGTLQSSPLMGAEDSLRTDRARRGLVCDTRD